MVSSGMSGQKWSQGQCVHSHILLYYLIYYYPAFFVEPLFLIWGFRRKLSSDIYSHLFKYVIEEVLRKFVAFYSVRHNLVAFGFSVIM